MSQRAARPASARVVPVVVGVALTVVLVAGVLAEPAGADTPTTAEGSVHYRPPVEAPVADPFRPPATAYGPGNRGLAYDLPAGTPVRAAADGRVVFAGPVARTRHVTVLHADGLRTSYSFLSHVAVRRGDRVRQGDVVGEAGLGFHLGVRDGDAYLDPAALFDQTVLHVRLVPHTEPLPPTDAGLLREQASLRELVRTERPGLLRRAWNVAFEHGAPIVGRWLAATDAALHAWWQTSPVQIALDVVDSLARHLLQECTPASFRPEPPTGERVALLVAGLGSTSVGASIDDVDVATLGYEPGDVVRYRYGGGRIPTDAPLHPGLAAIPEGPYAEADTLGDIADRGRELADLVEQAAAARPGVPIDLYAHSLGGLVTRVALLELADRPGGLDPLGQVVTIGSPHRGADLGTLAVLSEQRIGREVRAIRDVLDVAIDPYSPVVRQLAETSALVDRLRAEGVPDGVDLRTVGARNDLVVPGDKTHVPGHPSVITDPGGVAAHADLPGDAATTRELQLGLAGRPPTCTGFADALADAVVPEVISAATHSVGLLTAVPG